MSENRIKVLVLGGTGAMGRSLVSILSGQGRDVYVTSRSGHQNTQNITYLTGNAKDETFLRSLLKVRYDAIVDFMVYSPEEFKDRVDTFLGSCGQYVFISSARVYAPSETPLSEASPRLLDVCRDTKYMATNEYALSKAKQEDILAETKKPNYTVIRPSLTYNSNRLQYALGEKEDWLYRALNGGSIIMPDDMKDVQTSMAYGADVAKAIAALIGRSEAYGETVQIASPHSFSWSEVLDVYQRVLYRHIGHETRVVYVPDALDAAEKLDRYYQIKYARSINRTFDCSKLFAMTGMCRDDFMIPQDGLKKCLEEFLEKPEFLPISWRAQAYYDRMAHEKTGFNKFPSIKAWVAYQYRKNILHAKH